MKWTRWFQNWKLEPFEESCWVSIHGCLSWRTQTLLLWAGKPETPHHQECLRLLCRLTEMRRNLPPHINQEGLLWKRSKSVFPSSPSLSAPNQDQVSDRDDITILHYRSILVAILCIRFLLSHLVVSISLVHYPPSSSQSWTVWLIWCGLIGAVGSFFSALSLSGHSGKHPQEKRWTTSAVLHSPTCGPITANCTSAIDDEELHIIIVIENVFNRVCVSSKSSLLSLMSTLLYSDGYFGPHITFISILVTSMAIYRFYVPLWYRVGCLFSTGFSFRFLSL